MSTISPKSSGSPEVEEHLPGKIAHEATKQLESMVTDAWEQMIGTKKNPSESGEANPSQQHTKNPEKSTGENDLIETVLFQLGLSKNSEKTPQNSPETRRAAIDHKSEVMHAAEKGNQRLSSDIRQKIQEITAELKALIATTKELKMHFGSVTLETPTQKPGKYHENFFEWLLIMIQQARQKVENSNSWLGAIQGKGKGKGYWDKAKSHGTSFTQSGERSTVTSTG